MATELLRRDELLAARPTAASSVGEPPSPPITAELIPQVSALRYQADLHRADVVALDRDVFAHLLSEQTSAFERLGTQSLLAALAQRWGLSWAAIARMVGVSIPALRKWRMGEASTPANRSALARLAAFLEMLGSRFMVEDPAAWLEIPLGPSARTLADVYSSGRLDLVLDYARGWISTPQRVLDEWDPEWRSELGAHETYVASDGELAIRRRRG